MPAPILIHIGYPKTASTWLQQQFFKDPRSGFAAPWTLPNAEAIEHFTLSNPYGFDPKVVRKYFEAGIKQSNSKQLVPVISNEIIGGDPLRQWDWGREAADRIYQTFPDAHILVLIREQCQMLLSLYRQHIKQGGNMTLERFVDLGEERPGFRPGCRIENLEYHRLIHYYQNLFGSQNVLVWPFEQFKQDLHTSIVMFQKFAQTHGEVEVFKVIKAANVGYKGWTLRFRRRLNFICQPGFFGPGGPPRSWKIAGKLSNIFEKTCPSGLHEPIELQMKQYIESFVGERYQISNRLTSELAGIDLGHLGYKV